MKRFFLPLLSVFFFLVSQAQPTTAPNLSLPSNNKVDEKSTPYILWSIISGVTHYQLQFDTVSSFSSPFAYTDTAKANNKRPKDLKFGYKYFWRVRAVNSAGSGPWSTTWNFKVFSLPNVAVPSATPSNFFMVKGLTSHYANGAWVEYQFDTSLNFNSNYLRIERTAQADVTNMFYTGLYYCTKYYIRARAYHSNDTTPWISPRQATTSCLPNISAPVDNSTQTSFKITYSWLKNSWTVPDTGMIYQLQTDTSLLFANPVLDVYEDTLRYIDNQIGHYRFGKKYYFRVRSMHFRDTSDWDTVSFSIYSTPNIISPTTLNQKPEKLRIIPADHPGVEFFIYDLDTGSNVGSPANISDTILNWKAQPLKLGPYLKFGKKYTLGLRAVKGDDTSSMRKVTFNVLSAITLTSPSNFAWSTGVELDFSWSNALGDIAYQVRVDTVSAFGSPGQRIINVASNNFSKTVSDLWYGKLIYWSVRGMHPLDTSAWSASRSFTTAFRPTLSWPSNGVIDFVKNDELSCNEIEGSRFYEFQVSTDSLFATAFSDTAKVDPLWGDVNFPLSRFNLAYSTKYFWRVRAINALDSSDWSDTWRFTTRKELPTPKKVNLLSPSHNITTVPYVPYIIKFSWTTDSAEAYQFQFSRNSSFNPLDEIGFIFGTPEIEVDSLEPNTWYYWRVRAENAEKAGPWSDVFAFKTLPVLYPPFNLWPDNVSDVPLNQTIDWEDIDGANAFDYRIGTNPNLSSASIKPAFVSEAKPAGLQLNTHYYWEVRARNSYFYSFWSLTADFYTIKVTSTNELEGQMLFCYPNPAEERFNISLPENGEVEYSIYDVQGKLIVNEKQGLSGKLLSINTAELAPGVYSVVLRQNRQLYNLKFVR